MPWLSGLAGFSRLALLARGLLAGGGAEDRYRKVVVLTTEGFTHERSRFGHGGRLSRSGGGLSASRPALNSG
jgi:hypothetical protein